MKKILIAIDDSLSAMKAVDYVAEQFSCASLEVGLVHVLPNLPAIFWDEGHILSDDEKRDRKKVVDKWLAAQKSKMEPLLQQARETLQEKGVSSGKIETKFISDSTDVADSLLEEARDNSYRTVVIGRSHHSPKNVLGTVAGRIAAQGAGLAVIIVE